MDLGTKRPKNGELSVTSDKMPEKSYPSFTLNDKVAEAFCKEHGEDCKVGDELTATVKLKMSSLRKDQYGHSVGFDVVSLDDVKDAEGSENEEAKESDDEEEAEGDGEMNADTEEKTLGYKRSKTKTEKELPDTSAKSFLD